MPSPTKSEETLAACDYIFPLFLDKSCNTKGVAKLLKSFLVTVGMCKVVCGVVVMPQGLVVLLPL